ncbi:MAG: FAD binding domain-containing protein [Planctomycetota bacterium]|jgi:4-hydroxybenzoyl-CoA reductase subunit beta
MMRLPTFTYRAPNDVREAAKILKEEGPQSTLVAGGTDLYPNMKRRQVEPATVVSMINLKSLRGIEWRADGSLRIGPMETLRAIERDARIREELLALWKAVVSISTPILRNQGTIGGNLNLDTRCFYLNQNFEWRRTIDHCLKCTGDTCWTAPGGTKCWAVNSSDGVPAMIALGARFVLEGPDGTREIEAADLYDITDGREWLTRRHDEIMTDIIIPPQDGAVSTYWKLRRRDAFDFPVLGVAARVKKNGVVEAADIILNAVGPAPIRCRESEQALLGYELKDETIDEAKALSARAAKPLDNTDHMPSYRKRMIRVFVGRALQELAT